MPIPPGNTPAAVFGQNWILGQGAQLGSQAVAGLGGTDIFNQIPLGGGGAQATQAIFVGDHNWSQATATGTPSQLYAACPTPFSIALGTDAVNPVYVGINNGVSSTFGVPVYPGNRLQVFGRADAIWVVTAGPSQTYNYRAS